MTTLNVLSAGAMKPALVTLGPAFGTARGIEVALTFGPAPEVRARVEAGGGAFSVVIGPATLIGVLTDEGRLVDGSRTALGGVKAAVAVHKDAPDPDIATPDGVRRAVLAASAIVYNTASSGQYIDEMIRGLGIADEVEPRVKRFANAEDAMRFLGSPEGRSAIGFGQSSAIRGYEAPHGIRQTGPLPDEIGNVTNYEGAVAADAPLPDVAGAFLAFLTSDQGRKALRATGIE